MTDQRRNCALFFLALFAVTFALRLCHSGLLWADEDYHLAAGLQILDGKLLYRDLWYDKPPLGALLYASLGALPGWPLRLFDALYILAISAAFWRFARDLWGRREAYLAAFLTIFFLNFDFPAAILPLAPDFLLILPHVAAVHFAWQRRPLAAGLCCGVAFLLHTKAAFVLVVCGLLAWRSAPLLLAGFAIPNAIALAALALTGALPAYFEQVWRWSAAYAASSPDPQPILNGLRRTGAWMGFHAALVLGAAAFWWGNRKREHAWWAAWIAISFAGVALGARFFPRYYLQLLPPLVLLAAWALARRRTLAIIAALTLLVPLIRFGPRYWTLAKGSDPQWVDTALERDTQAAATLVNARQQPGDTLFVWGYRPGVFVYTRMPAGARFWDSQPLTGVPADRHLRDDSAVLSDDAQRNRIEFARSRPTFVVDSLSLSNPRLSMERYPELQSWLAHYELVARTPLTLVYRRR